ncbi:MAG: hypothetical protein AB7P76_12240 [Candidatus Melainabacteria bacterium]
MSIPDGYFQVQVPGLVSLNRRTEKPEPAVPARGDAKLDAAFIETYVAQGLERFNADPASQEPMPFLDSKQGRYRPAARREQKEPRSPFRTYKQWLEQESPNPVAPGASRRKPRDRYNTEREKWRMEGLAQEARWHAEQKQTENRLRREAKAKLHNRPDPAAKPFVVTPTGAGLTLLGAAAALAVTGRKAILGGLRSHRLAGVERAVQQAYHRGLIVDGQGQDEATRKLLAKREALLDKAAR